MQVYSLTALALEPIFDEWNGCSVFCLLSTKRIRMIRFRRPFVIDIHRPETPTTPMALLLHDDELAHGVINDARP